jgi:hypothetical protein
MPCISSSLFLLSHIRVCYHEFWKTMFEHRWDWILNKSWASEENSDKAEKEGDKMKDSSSSISILPRRMHVQLPTRLVKQGDLDALLVETNQYYQQYFDYLPNGHSHILVPDVTKSDMFLFLMLCWWRIISTTNNTLIIFPMDIFMYLMSPNLKCSCF